MQFLCLYQSTVGVSTTTTTTTTTYTTAATTTTNKNKNNLFRQAVLLAVLFNAHKDSARKVALCATVAAQKKESVILCALICTDQAPLFKLILVSIRQIQYRCFNGIRSGSVCCFRSFIFITSYSRRW